MTFFLYLTAIGLVIGTFVGISGVGGGSIMTPALILILGVNPLVAVGTDLLYSVPTKILGAFLHARQRTVEWSVVARLLLGGIPGVILGALLLYWLRHTIDITTLNTLTKRSVAIALFASAAALAYSALVRRSSSQNAQEPTQIKGRSAALVVTGALVGFCVVLTSIGSGAMTMPLLLLIVPFVGIRRLVGSDIVYAAFLIPTATLGHIALGDVNYGVAGALLVGALPGVAIGTKLCKSLPEVWLRPLVAIILLVAGWRLV